MVGESGRNEGWRYDEASVEMIQLRTRAVAARHLKQGSIDVLGRVAQKDLAISS